MPVEEKDAAKADSAKLEVKTKTIEAKPLTKKFAKCRISHGHSARTVKDPHSGLAKDICDTLIIEAGAELPPGFDPVAEGLEEGVHWEMGR